MKLKKCCEKASDPAWPFVSGTCILSLTRNHSTLVNPSSY